MKEVGSSRCSLVIRCYNEEKHIGRLLDGIAQQTVAPVEIILVDSGSTDGTLSVANRYPVKIVHVKPQDFSFGHSLNLGCANASQELIVIASAHVYPVYRDWLEQLLDPFSDPEVVLVYGKQRGGENTKFSEHRIFAKLFPETALPFQDHPFCNNANAAVRRSAWKKQLYEESLTGLEDIDWAKRAFQHGYKIAYSPNATVIHVHEENLVRIYNRYRREAIAFHRIFPAEHFNFRDFLLLYFKNVVSDLYHAGSDRALLRNLAPIVLFRLMQFWGTYRGFAQRGPVSNRLRQHFYYPNDTPSKPITEEREQRIEYKERKVGLHH